MTSRLAHDIRDVVVRLIAIGASSPATTHRYLFTGSASRADVLIGISGVAGARDKMAPLSQRQMHGSPQHDSVAENINTIIARFEPLWFSQRPMS
jgi:hypothetical protein